MTIIAQPAFSQASTTPAKTEPAAAIQPAFEVATIKPLDPNAARIIMGFYSYPGGRVFLGAASLRMMIYFAYNVQMYQITGGPDWVDKDRYNIEAHPPANSESATSKPRFSPSKQIPAKNSERCCSHYSLKDLLSKCITRPKKVRSTF